MESYDLTVVIAVHNAHSVIATCLGALIADIGDRSVEVIVADSSTDGTAELVRQQFPSLRVVTFDPSRTLPQLRGAAIAMARGRIVAILDPYSVVVPGWTEEVLRVHAARSNPAIGGSVGYHSAGRRDLFSWTTYVNEYGGFMPPCRAGAVGILPGSNCSYKREVFTDLEAIQAHGFWKTFANWELESRGQPLWLAPNMQVELYKPIPFWEFFRSRYDHGRCFAAMRAAREPGLVRGLRAALSPALPALFLWRLLRNCWPSARPRFRLLQSMPLHTLLFASWAWGEFCGYLAGSGRSCSRLYY